ncbi:MAG: aspartyl protease family protein [Alphaproteobacteria bacterium]|nr:aspartyl protease family protein [Alphaproteobacteria bacterium]
MRPAARTMIALAAVRAALCAAVLAGGAMGAAAGVAAQPPVRPSTAPSAATSPATPAPAAAVPPAEDEAVYAIPTRKDRIGRVLAPVHVNGQGPFKFIVDTGANSSVASPRLAEALGLTPQREAGRFVVHGVTGSIEAATIPVASFRADTMQQTNLRMPVMDGGILAGADGVFGVDALAGRRLLVDFRKDRIEIGPAKRRYAPSRGLRLKGKLRFGALFLTEAEVGGVKVAAVIDTGAERSIANSALLQALRARAASMREVGEVAFTGATGAYMQGRLVYLPPLNVSGTLQIMEMPTIVADAHVFTVWGLTKEPALLVGMDVLGQADVLSIDYKRAEMVLLLPYGPEARDVRLTR